MRSLDQRAASCVSSTRAASGPRARLYAALAAAVLASGLGGCSVSYPLFGANEGDDAIKTGSIDAHGLGGDQIVAAPSGGAVSGTPLPPPAGASAAQPAAASATPAAYAPQGGPVQDAEAALTPSDWAYARGALSIAMGADATNATVPWANPDSGSYGAFSASAGTTTENGATCRPFSGSHSAGGREQRLEGRACRTAAGYWEAVAIHTTASRTL